MKRLLLYTENYEPGGGNKYLLDFLGSVPAPHRVVIASNHGAFREQNGVCLPAGVQVREIDIRSTGLRARRLVGVLHAPRMVLEAVRMALIRFQRFPVIRLIFLWEDSWFNRSAFRELLRSERIAAAVAFNGGFPAALSCFDMVLACRDLGIPNGMSVVSMPGRVSTADLFYRRAARGIGLLVVNCQAIRDSLVRTRGMNAGMIDVLPNCVDEAIRAAAVKGRPGRPAGRFIFGYVGRIQKEKGIDVLLRAMAILKKERPDILLEAVGKVYGIASLKRRLKTLGLLEDVRIRGFFPGSIYEVLEDLDAFVFPSLWEGLPYAVLEAMHAGNAVIATRVGGIPELIQDGRNGILVPRNDPARLAEAMRRVIDDPDFRKAMARQAEDTIKERFLPERFAAETRRILLRIFPGDREIGGDA